MTRDDDTVGADAGDLVNPARAAAVGAEDLDEDRIDADPLEDGMDAPDDWSAADRAGMTPSEQREGETLDERLAQEEPEPEVALGGTDADSKG